MHCVANEYSRLPSVSAPGNSWTLEYVARGPFFFYLFQAFILAGKMFVPTIEVNQFHILHGCQQSVTKDILQAVDFLAGLAVKDQGKQDESIKLRKPHNFKE